MSPIGTPVPVYKKLVEFHKAGLLDFQHVTTFNMDEYCNLPESHPESYHTFMWENLFKHINIDPKNVHILNGNAPNLVAECDEYERKIEAAGGINLFMAGIGPDGHIAFNEPVKTLHEDLYEAYALESACVCMCVGACVVQSVLCVVQGADWRAHRFQRARRVHPAFLC